MQEKCWTEGCNWTVKMRGGRGWQRVANLCKHCKAVKKAAATPAPAALLALPAGHPLRRMWAKSHPEFQA